MKLGFILFDYFPYGGLQRNCVAIAQKCRERGDNVTVVTRTWQGQAPEGVEVVTLGTKGWTNIKRNRTFLKELHRQLPRFGFDGLVGFNKIPGMDVCYIADPCFREKARRLKPGWFQWSGRFRHFEAMERGVFERGGQTHLLILSEIEQRHFERHYQTERHRFHLLPPGITRREPDEAEQSAARARVRKGHGVADTETLLLFVGSGFRTKGLDRVIRGLASLPRSVRDQTRLLVIGRQPPGGFGLLSKALGVAKRVHFLGGRDDVYDFLLAGDLLVHPAYSENTGTVLLEALTAGLPVLTTDVCGFGPHIERAEAGRVIPTPMSQSRFNRELHDAVLSDARTQWRKNAFEYAAGQDLYSRHERAAEAIEAIVRAKLQRLSCPAQ